MFGYYLLLGLLFTAGTILLLLIGLVHALSLFGTPTPANDTEKQLFSLMRDYHFNLMGSSRSMNDLMRGFSMAFMLAAFGFGIFDLALRKERTELLKRCVRLSRKFKGGEVPRPPYWTGFRVQPSAIEFWTHRAHRLHSREIYARRARGWRRDLLQP